MPATILDGAALARQVRAEVALRARRLSDAGRPPGLAVLLVGDDPASAVYVRNKVKACEEAGIRSLHEHLPADTAQEAIVARVRALNADPAVHGILVQLPLPPHVGTRAVIAAIDPAKDVDGLHEVNAGALAAGDPRFKPCTPYGVMRLLEHAGVALRGAHAVVVGASNLVGKPAALLLLQAGATVTICNSKTRDLATHARSADVLVSAVGRPGTIRADMVKPGAIVIDVGTTRLADGPRAGRLAGDVDFDAAREVAGAITPVPGGVGPMTIAMLLVNTVEAAERTR
jgi:methylenetetrahydrofolate dehydrogenase (NADP+)/methenyltetrahydrofolate cyclohydrolase